MDVKQITPILNVSDIGELRVVRIARLAEVLGLGHSADVRCRRIR